MVTQRANTHPVLKGLLFLCILIPTIGCVLMTMGAWRFEGDMLDGSLRTLAIMSGVLGAFLILLLDKIDS